MTTRTYATRTYAPSVRVGNWNEDIQLEEVNMISNPILVICTRTSTVVVLHLLLVLLLALLLETNQ